MIFWGGTFVAGRIVSREANPFSAAFLRFVVASFFLLIFVMRSNEKIPRFEVRQIVLFFFLGLTGVFAYNYLFFSGLYSSRRPRISYYRCKPSLYRIGIGADFRRKARHGEHARHFCFRWRCCGRHFARRSRLALSGKTRRRRTLHSRLCGQLGILFPPWQVALRNTTPLLAVTCACLMGAACLFFPAFHEGVLSKARHLSLSVWLAIFFLGFFGSALGFVWYYEGIRSIGPSRAGVFINLVPVSSVLLAFFLLNEGIDFSLVLGGALIIAGVYLTNRPRPDDAAWRARISIRVNTLKFLCQSERRTSHPTPIR